MYPFDDDFLWEWPDEFVDDERDRRKRIRESKEKIRQSKEEALDQCPPKTSTSAPPNVPKAKSSKNTNTNLKKSKED